LPVPIVDDPPTTGGSDIITADDRNEISISDDVIPLATIETRSSWLWWLLLIPVALLITAMVVIIKRNNGEEEGTH
jgi:hypothetical protein